MLHIGDQGRRVVETQHQCVAFHGDRDLAVPGVTIPPGVFHHGKRRFGVGVAAGAPFGYLFRGVGALFLVELVVSGDPIGIRRSQVAIGDAVSDGRERAIGFLVGEHHNAQLNVRDQHHQRDEPGEAARVGHHFVAAEFVQPPSQAVR